MKTSISFLLKSLLVLICLVPDWAFAQTNISLLNDTAKTKLNMDAVYNRPFLTTSKLPVALGGYIEANSQYASGNGYNEGLHFQMRRMTLFVSSSVAKKIKFLSELEFEEGTKEINLEYCALDFEMHPLLNLRGGIILNPIGAFNQNHDGPRWDFIDRPIEATGIIPSTLSNVGMGFNGKYFSRNWILGYEMYVTNGFDNKVIDNEEGRTSLHAGKENANKFAESSNGMPLFTGKLAVRNRNIGELGISYMSGVYNNFKSNGIVIDKQRQVNVFALDFASSLFKNKLNIQGELAQVWVDVPEYFSAQYGNRQLGFYTDFVYTLLQQQILGWDKAKLNLGCRAEYVDYNLGTFKENNSNIGDDIWAMVPSIAFRPTGTTVIRLNYRIEQAHDLQFNPPTQARAIQFGFSSYF